MNCTEARRLLSACLDRDLTFAEDEELRRHLRECATCSEEMTCLENVQAMLRSLPETQPEPGFFESVCRRIAETQAQPDRIAARSGFSLGGFLKDAFAPAWLRPAAGVAFGLVIGLLIQVHGGPADSPATRSDGGRDLAAEADVAPGVPTELAVELPGSPAGARSEGPLADLALPDSSLMDPEYIHDPFVSGPQGRPVRMQVGASREHNAYITF